MKGVLQRRVVVTGMGLVTPVGNTVDAAWRNIIAGRSGIGRVTKVDPTPFASHIAGEVKDFDPTEYLDVKEVRRLDTFVHYGLAAGGQALKDSQLKITEENSHRIGVNIGSGIGGLPMIENTLRAYGKGGAKKVSPFFIPGTIINMISGVFSIQHGIKGPNLASVSACSTSSHALAVSALQISAGDADVMIAGGSESTICDMAIAGFSAAKALSTRNDDPERASRPWDKERDGFILAEGAGVMVLEELGFARARGAKIYAELVGYGMSGDAYHITAPSADGDGAYRCMQNALRHTGLAPQDVHYINAHGTSTELGDLTETIAVKRCFGDHARKLVVSSTKSMTGHLLGAAGGVEAIFCVLALRDQIAPPTINLHQPGEGCDLDYVPLKARPMPMEVVMSNSFGFGGTNSSLIFRRYS